MTSPHLAPTSPQVGGRPHRSTSPLAPYPRGGEVELSRHDEQDQPPHIAPPLGATWDPWHPATSPHHQVRIAVCGHTNGPWTCTITGPHQAGRHYYVKAAP